MLTLKSECFFFISFYSALLLKEIEIVLKWSRDHPALLKCIFWMNCMLTGSLHQAQPERIRHLPHRKPLQDWQKTKPGMAVRRIEEKSMVSESVELKQIVHIVVFVNYLTGHLLINKSFYPLIFISWNLLTNLGHIVFNLWRLKHLYHLDIAFACNFIDILFVIAANIWTY